MTFFSITTIPTIEILFFWTINSDIIYFTNITNLIFRKNNTTSKNILLIETPNISRIPEITCNTRNSFRTYRESISFHVLDHSFLIPSKIYELCNARSKRRRTHRAELFLAAFEILDSDRAYFLGLRQTLKRPTRSVLSFMV